MSKLANLQHLTNESHEMGVIGSLILDSSKYDLVTTIVKPADFYDLELRELFELLCDLHEIGKPIGDSLIVKTECKRRGLKIGIDRIAQAFSEPTAANVQFYAETVLEMSRLRNLLQLGESLTCNVKQPNADSKSETDKIESRLKMLNSTRRIDILSAPEAVARYNLIDETDIMAATGIPKFDQHFGGFSRAELVLIAQGLAAEKPRWAGNLCYMRRVAASNAYLSRWR